MKILVFLSCIAGALATITWGLLGVSFSWKDKSKYPFLGKLDRLRIPLLITAIICTLLVPAFLVWKESIASQSPFQFKQLDDTAAMLIGTENGLEKELAFLKPAVEIAKKAKDYYMAGIHELEETRIEEAASNFKKSVEVLETKIGYLNLGFCLTYLCDYDGARSALTSGLKIAKREDNLEFQMGFHQNFGNTYLGDYRYQDSLKSFQEVIQIAKKLDLPDFQGNASLSIGIINYFLGKKDEALKYYNKALEFNKKAKNPIIETNSLNNIGIIRADRGEVEEALRLFRLSLKIAQENEVLIAEANALNNLGLIFREQDKADQALDSFNKSLEISKDAHYFHGQMNAYLNMGETYNKSRKYEKALESLEMARKIGEQAKAFQPLATVYLSLGSTYKRKGRPLTILKTLGDTPNVLEAREASSGEYKKALDCYKKSVELSTKVNDTELKATGLVVLAGTYLEIERIDKALDTFELATEITKNAAEKLLIANGFSQISEHLLKNAENDDALDAYHKALAIYEETNFQLKMAETLKFIGQIHYNKSNLNDALDSFFRSVAIYEENEDELYKALMSDTQFESRDFLEFTLTRFSPSLKSLEDFNKKTKAYEKEYEKEKESRVRSYLATLKGEVLISLGSTYFSKKELTNALDAYNKAFMIFEHTDKIYEKAQALHGIGAVYFAQGKKYEALEKLQKAHLLYSKANASPEIIKGLEEAIKRLRSDS